MKRILVEEYGIPSDEIRFIQESKTQSQREQLIEDMKAGRVRIFFGSTKKMGTGVNAQNRAVACHHLDVPWKPDAFEQRNGRPARPGNWVAKNYAHNRVACFVYGVERSLDNYKFNLLHTKQTFIKQIKSRTIAVRRIDEGAADESTGVNFAEFVAVLSGNTDLLTKAKLDEKIAALTSERKSFYNQRTMSENRLQALRNSKEHALKQIAILREDLAYLNRVAPANKKGKRPNRLTIFGESSPKAEDQLDKLVQINDKVCTSPGEYRKIGKLYDFDVVVNSQIWYDIHGEKQINNRFFVDSGKGILYSHNHGVLSGKPEKVTQMFIHAVDKIPGLVDDYLNKIKEAETDIPVLEEITRTEWGRDGELTDLQNEAAALDRKIQLEINQADEQEVEDVAAVEVPDALSNDIVSPSEIKIVEPRTVNHKTNAALKW